MKEFSDFEQLGEEVMDCAASLYCITDQIREKLTDKMGDLDFDNRGMVATLGMLVSQLEDIARGISESVKFHESPEGEKTCKALARMAVVNE